MLKYTFCLKINISCKLLAIMLVHLCAHVLAFRFPLWDVLTVKVANGAAKIEEASVGRLGFMACLSSEDLRVSNGAAHLDQRRHTNTSTFPIGRFSPRRDFSVHLRSSGCCCCSGLGGSPGGNLWTTCHGAEIESFASLLLECATGKHLRKRFSVAAGRRKMKINCNSSLIMRCKLMLFYFCFLLHR